MNSIPNIVAGNIFDPFGRFPFNDYALNCLMSRYYSIVINAL